ncbi:methyl-accepting chemotaxis protein [uncultured Shewanella sp.]|uniref:methyl-accepting chemotaxis protein n=1 Tax=uncultured Shewanella sp. TaxID=173975 RepID=UPI00260A994C|nr:methyl-accepting chemotaxis protein [uncultured Shewanella sp.]
MKTITGKITSLVILIVLLVSSMLAGINYWSSRDSLLNEYQQQQNSITEQLNVILKEPVFVYDKDAINSIITALVHQPLIASIKVVDQRNRHMGQTATEQSIDDNGAVDIIWEGKKIGTVHIGFSKESVNQALSDTLFQALFSTLFTLVVLVILLVVVVRKVMVEPLLEVNNVLADIAGGGGNLTARIPVKRDDEIGQLAENFNSFINTVQDIITDIADAEEQLKQVSIEVKNINQKAIQGNAKQSDLTSVSLSNLHQLDMATKEIATNSESTSFKTQQAYKLSVDSQKDIHNNIEQVKLLVANLDKTAQEVTELKQASDNIGKVLDVIKGIAEQTNLLALNAAIEAARAGESGRGFAVVADEVRALASKTHHSTTEIQSIISHLQQQAETSYQATITSKDLVAVTIETTHKTGDSLQQITDEMSSINDMITMIASACEEQANVTSTVSTDMQVISEGALSLTDDAEQLKETTAHLIEVSKQMESQIHRFSY